jgi:hypothetical protein
MTTPTATPLLNLRRIIWDDGSTSLDPEDYAVVDERGERIGRMYRTIAVGGGEAWRWTVYGMAAHNIPSAGMEPTGEEAMTSLRRRGQRASRGSEARNNHRPRTAEAAGGAAFGCNGGPSVDSGVKSVSTFFSGTSCVSPAVRKASFCLRRSVTSRARILYFS